MSKTPKSLLLAVELLRELGPPHYQELTSVDRHQATERRLT